MRQEYQDKQNPASRNHPRQLSLFSVFRERLPKRPYCTNDLESGLVVRPAEQAAEYRYIQHNPPVYKSWLNFDIDRRGAIYAAEDADLPAPTLIVENPANHHAHLLYGVAIPVCISPAGRPEPIRYAGAVDVAFAEALGADRGYSGLICKNPLHPGWIVHHGPELLYDLGELAEYVDLRPYRDKRKKLPSYGLGRNCTLFDRLRFWAYRNVDICRAGSYEEWMRLVERQAEHYNDFESPLPWPEIKATAKSVGKWTWHHYSGRFDDALFAKIQGARGKKGMAQRWGEKPDSTTQALLWED